MREQRRRGGATAEFRSLLTDLIGERSGGNVRDFAVDAGWSHTTFYEIMNGQRKPSPELVERLAAMFPAKARDLYLAGERPLPPTLISPTPAPRGARPVAERGRPLPLGPPVSAHDMAGGGDQEHDVMDLSDSARAVGADYVMEVVGRCLEPTIHRGDYVAVMASRTASNGEVVVAHAVEDAFTGELGDGFTLKVYRTGGSDPGYYRADGTRALGPGEAEVVGRVVGIWKRTVPSFK